MLRIGIDTGGTFTDFVWVEDGRRSTHKVPSTPDDPSRAVFTGLRHLVRQRARPSGRPGEAAGEAKDLHLPAGCAVVHGSTVATNALLEGKGAQVAFLTNLGFEDLLELGRQARPSLYDASVQPPPPLAERRFCYGIPGRLGPGGEELAPLDLAAVKDAVRTALEGGVRHFAICFLHSYASAAHEERSGEIVREAGGDATLSSAILPEYREFERASTTVVNATLAPVMTRYLERLEESLGDARLSIFRSNGGILSARAAGREAAQTLLSGPAAGVIGAWRWAAGVGLGRLLTFDMGGTSTDVCLCAGGPVVTTEAEVGGYPVRLPMIDIHTVGAGGGSLARRDPGGALLVGPQSAGADSGPACYGRGDRPTVTDAHLVLGRIPGEGFLEGRMPLYRRRADQVLDRLAVELGIPRLAAAEGVIRVANAGMERALRTVSVARGHDPRDFALFCYGGAGGLHAAELAGALGMPEVIVPPQAGMFSAWGMTVADVVRDASIGVLADLSSAGRPRRDRLAAPLEQRLFREMEQEGFAPADLVVERTLDLRYRGQSFELNVPEGDDPRAAFHRLHRQRYDQERPGADVELVTLRVRAIGRVPPPPVTPPARPAAAPPAAVRSGRIWFQGEEWRTSFHDRRSLEPGACLAGPAVISEAGATTLLPPGWQLQVDVHGNLRLAQEGSVAPPLPQGHTR
ncbi:MAG: hydantoinase/oxoprolinase family protein [Acidobacteriota bacterium]